MNKQQKIFNILAKAQEPRKIELGMAQDIQKSIEKAETIWKNSMDSVGQILKTAVDKIDQEVRPLTELGVKLYTDGQAFKKEAEKLGIDPSDVMRDVNNAIDAIGKRSQYMQQVNGIIRQNF